jgi:hypothetical protein
VHPSATQKSGKAGDFVFYHRANVSAFFYKKRGKKVDECPCMKIQIYVQENFFCIFPFMEAKEEKSPFYFFFSKIMQKFFYLFFSSFCGVVKKIILTPL